MYNIILKAAIYFAQNTFAYPQCFLSLCNCLVVNFHPIWFVFRCNDDRVNLFILTLMQIIFSPHLRRGFLPLPYAAAPPPNVASVLTQWYVRFFILKARDQCYPTFSTFIVVSGLNLIGPKSLELSQKI